MEKRQEETHTEIEKKAYHKPQVREYGSIRTITQAIHTSGVEDGGADRHRTAV